MLFALVVTFLFSFFKCSRCPEQFIAVDSILHLERLIGWGKLIFSLIRRQSSVSIFLYFLLNFNPEANHE